MAVFVACLVLFLAMTGHSSALYCTCNNGVSDPVLQKNIDYACGNGADCTQIIQSGSCYNPNTVRDHCNYAVNSYYQRKNQATGSCDFSGTATVTPTAPSGQSSGCVYPASPSTAGTPSTPTTGTPGTPTTGTPTTPNTGTPGSTTPGSTNPTTGTPTTVFGLGPTGSGTGLDNTGGTVNLNTNLLCSFTLMTLLFSGLFFLKGF